MFYFPNLKPVCSSMSHSNCCFLTCIQIYQEAGQVVWYSHFVKNFLQSVVIHTVKGFGVVNEADVFMELLLLIQWMLAIYSGSSAFSKSSLYIWKFLAHVLLKPSLKDFEHYRSSMWNARLMKHKLESRFLGETAITSDMQITPPLWQKVKRK